MKDFPSKLNVENKETFSAVYTERTKCYLRRDIFEHVISHDENDYFYLDKFNEKYNDIELIRRLVEELIPELEALGWKCNLSFGGTGLFIYSTDEPPPSCWQETETFS